MRYTSTCSRIILLELNTRQSNLVIIRVIQQKRIETIVQQFKKSTTLLTISYDSQQTTKRTKTSFWIVRRVWRYQRCNQNSYIEEEQTTQWPKVKVQKHKQRSTKHTHKTKDRVTRTPEFTSSVYFKWDYTGLANPTIFVCLPKSS
jgi:hypothetical protein